MKKLLCVLLLATSLVSTTPGLADESEGHSKAQVSAELLGAGFLYSVFGSYRFIPQLALNAGLSYISVSANNVSSSLFNIPLSLSYLLGSGNSFLEALAGGSIFTGTNSLTGTGFSAGLSGWVTQFGLGYRYWPGKGGFHFRATAYGMLVRVPKNNNINDRETKFLPWVGLSFGYAFK